jgi:AcrR family transcriptional regulator
MTTATSRRRSTPWSARLKRRNPDFDVKKVAILRTAARLFASRGYQDVSLNDVAGALRVTKPTLYYYFSSKDEILCSIKSHVHDEFVAALAEIRATDKRGIEQIEDAMRRYIDIICSDFGKAILHIHDRVLSKASRNSIRDRTDEIDAHLFALYERAVREGDMRALDRKVIHYTLFGALNWNPNWYNPRGRIPLRKLADLQVSILLDGLRRR